MKKNLIKISSLILSGLMITSVLPTFAYEKDVNNNSIESVKYQNTDDEDYTNQTNVFAELGSEYSVTIPKTIVLSGIDKKASYYVKVKGDIAGYETVNVIPDETVSLYTKNKGVQTGIINQDKTAWKIDNFDTDANGNIEASGLTAGKWSGTFNFNINLEDEQAMVIERVLGDLVLPPVDEWNNINVPVVTSLNAGETGTLKSLNNSLSNSEKMTITSSNENVAVIKDNKTICAVAPGTTKITTLVESKEDTKSFQFNLKVNESPLSKVELPEVGTKLIDMSFAQIQKIAREGKTADYGIKLYDTIKVNDKVEAQVISIGEDYIEFCTVQKVVDSDGYTDKMNVYATNGGVWTLEYNKTSSFYDSPQVGDGIANTAQISYVGSNIQKQVEKWLNEQSDEFKSSLKEVEHTYDVATLTYTGPTNGGYNCFQRITGTTTDIEKVYIPSVDYLQKLRNSKKYTHMCFWTSSMTEISGNDNCIFGYVNNFSYDNINQYYGKHPYGAVAMFRIG